MNRTEYRADVLRYSGVGAALRAIVSDVEHGIDRITRHQTTAAQAAASTSAAETAATATIEPNPREEPVSAFSDALHGIAEKVADDLHAAAGKVEHIDDEAITALTAVKGNPATAPVFAVLHDLTGLNFNPDVLALLVTGLTELRDRLKAAAVPAVEPQPVPAGPQVAGQA